MIYNKQEDVSRIYVSIYMQIHICANTFCIGTRYPRDGFWEQLCALFISGLSYLRLKVIYNIDLVFWHEI